MNRKRLKKESKGGMKKLRGWKRRLQKGCGWEKKRKEKLPNKQLRKQKKQPKKQKKQLDKQPKKQRESSMRSSESRKLKE